MLRTLILLVCLLLQLASLGPALARPQPTRSSWDREIGRGRTLQLRRAERRRYRYQEKVQDVPALTPKGLKAALTSLQRSERAQVRTFGQVGDYPLGRIDLPALPRGKGSRRPLRVLISAGIHGNETAGPQVALKLAQKALKDKGLAQRFEITILPLLNVPGARKTPAGRDLNRLFTANSSVATVRAVQRELDRADYDLVVDLHGALREGFFLIRGNDDGKLSRRILGSMERAALLDAPPEAPQVSSYTLHCLGGCSSQTPGTFKGYMAQRAPYSYTLEAPRRLPPDQQVRGMYKLLLSTMHNVYHHGGLN